MKNRNNELYAIGCLTSSLLSWAFMFLRFFLSSPSVNLDRFLLSLTIVLPLLSLGFGLIAFHEMRRYKLKKKNLLIAGLVLDILPIIYSIYLLFWSGILIQQ